jgi:hypothetical protein
MNLVAYLRDNLAGAWQVMLGRSQGLNRLDTSLDGFWRSFAAIVFLIPFTSMSLLSQDLYNRNSGIPARLTGGSFGIYGIALVVDWVAFPLIFAVLARVFGFGARYVPFIVSRNWASVILTALAAIVDLLHLGGVLPSPALPVAGLIVTAIAIYVSYKVTRTALAVSVVTAVPIVVLDILVSLTIWSAFKPLGYA